MEATDAMQFSENMTGISPNPTRSIDYGQAKRQEATDFYLKGRNPHHTDVVTQKGPASERDKNNLSEIQSQYNYDCQLLFTSNDVNDGLVTKALESRAKLLNQKIEHSQLSGHSPENGNTLENLLEQTNVALRELNHDIPRGTTLNRVVGTMQSETRKYFETVSKGMDGVKNIKEALMKKFENNKPQILKYLDELH